MPIADISNQLLEIYRPFIGAVAFLLGAIIGSFINVVVHRLPIIMERDWRNSCSQLLFSKTNKKKYAHDLGLGLPASHCPNCLHNIRWYENIPLISFFLLQGKCSNCQQAISLRYPLVELSCALLSLTVFIVFGLSYGSIAALVLTWSLLTLSLIDYDQQLLPDGITLPLLWFGLLINCFEIFVTLQDAVVGAIAGYLILWSVYWGFKLLSGKEGMGYGDFKLLAAIGAWAGWQILPIVILLSSILGSIVGIANIIINKRDSQVPLAFGPFLAMAGWIALLWRDALYLYLPPPVF